MPQLSSHFIEISFVAIRDTVTVIYLSDGVDD